MKTSDNITEIAKALVAAQKELRIAKKTADNPFFKSKYADLPEVWKIGQEVLPKNGLCIAQTVETRIHNDSICEFLLTRLMHTSGQWIESEYPLKSVKSDPQSVGSCLTYARRYSFMAIVGITAEEDDDDGSAASDKPKAPVRVEEKPIPHFNFTNPMATALEQLYNMASRPKVIESGWTKDNLKAYMVKVFNVKSSQDLTQNQCELLTGVLKSSTYQDAMAECMAEEKTFIEKGDELL